MTTQDVIWLRPEQATTGRPAERSRAEITAAAIALADAEGLDAVSMRRVAAELGTGAASLYRYVSGREDLLDLMVDATAAEHVHRPPTGDWLADLVAIGGRIRAIMRRHTWLPTLVTTRATLGPNGVDLLEHVLAVLADHPADGPVKLEAFALLNALVATHVHNETAAGSEPTRRQTAYMRHVAAEGGHPRLAEALTRETADPGSADRFDDVLSRVLTGLLG